jgi:hypothetical protein
MATRTRLSVTLYVHCLSYLIYKNLVLKDSLPPPSEHNDNAFTLDSISSAHYSAALLSPLGLSLALFSTIT